MAYTTTHPAARPARMPVAPARVPRAAPPSEDERTLVTLEAARAVVERGWMQDGWYRTPARTWRQRLFGPVPGPDDLEAACLVAAVAVAGHAGGAFVHLDRDSGPAFDRVWDALRESRGHDGPGGSRPDEGSVAPIVRRARMRELVRWNDAPGRTRDDVTGLLDRAISRTILDQVRPRR